MKKLLVIDDELGSRESLREIFHKRCEVHLAESARVGLKLLSEQSFDLIILDVAMAEMDGITFLKRVREIYPEIPVIMISGVFPESSMGEALHLGAVGFLRKPFNVHELRSLVDQSIAASEAPRQRDVLQREVVREFSLLNVVGQSSAFRRTIEDARKASQSDEPVLIVGERGTGKEFLARQIHSWSRRSDDSFFSLACNDDRAEVDATIFGIAPQCKDAHRRGALDIVGRGTLFLDEIEMLPWLTQELVCNVLKRRQFHRVGSTQGVPTDARIFSSVSCSLGRDGTLNPELAAAFATSIIVPPLRERPEDIPHLAYHFLNQLRSTLNASTLDIDVETMRKLRAYSWPGNIRELRNVIERMLVLCESQKCLKAAALPREFHKKDPVKMGANEVMDFEEAVQGFERTLVVNALQRSNGVVKEAANLLRTTPRILQYRIDKLGIKKMAG